MISSGSGYLFDRKFKEASYALVTTAWEDELDELFQEERTRIQAKDVVCEEKEDALIFHTTALKLVMKKQPIQFPFCMMRKES